MDFTEQLKRQLHFLAASCTSYDAGSKDEAIRIAVVLRTLFHKTPKSTSLLSHLNTPYIKLLSTSEVIHKAAGFWTNLTVLKLSPIEGWAEYAPKLDTAQTKNFVSFGKWWLYESVYILGKLNVTRKDLVLAAANKDGGAHVDKKLDPDYETILNGVGWSIELNPPGGGTKKLPFKYGHLAALRQMGYEVLNSPDLLKLVGL